jgi:hypothetical protein
VGLATDDGVVIGNSEGQMIDSPKRFKPNELRGDQIFWYPDYSNISSGFFGMISSSFHPFSTLSRRRRRTSLAPTSKLRNGSQLKDPAVGEQLTFVLKKVWALKKDSTFLFLALKSQTSFQLPHKALVHTKLFTQNTCPHKALVLRKLQYSV